MKLSILVAGLLQRHDSSRGLAEALSARAAVFPFDVEVLWLEDRGTLATGLKRNSLMALASGSHFAFVDDDDRVAPDYIASLLHEIRRDPSVDMVSFDIAYSVDGVPKFTAKYDPKAPEPDFIEGHAYEMTEVVYPASHTNCWRKELVKDLEFAPRWWQEDIHFTREAVKRVQNWKNIPRVLYYYDCRSGRKEHRSMQALADARGSFAF